METSARLSISLITFWYSEWSKLNKNKVNIGKVARFETLKQVVVEI